MVEIVEFLKKFAERVPNFGAKGLIQVEIPGMDELLLIEGVSEGSSIKYRIGSSNTVYNWNPRAANAFRWKTTDIFRGSPTASALRVYGPIHPVVIAIDKAFGDYTGRWPNGGGN